MVVPWNEILKLFAFARSPSLDKLQEAWAAFKVVVDFALAAWLGDTPAPQSAAVPVFEEMEAQCRAWASADMQTAALPPLLRPILAELLRRATEALLGRLFGPQPG